LRLREQEPAVPEDSVEQTGAEPVEVTEESPR